MGLFGGNPQNNQKGTTPKGGPSPYARLGMAKEVKPQPKVIDKSAFANRGELSQNAAISWLRKQPDLYKVYPKRPGEDDYMRARRALQDLFPQKGVSLKENVGSMIDKKRDWFQMSQREKHLAKDIRGAYHSGQGIRVNERRLDLLKRFRGENKNNVC